jgi:hypothetical protein
MDRRIEIIRNPDVRRPIETYTTLYSLIHDYRFISSVFNYLNSLDLSGFNAGDVAAMSDIKQQVIDASTTSADMLAREFAKEYTGNVATLEMVRLFVTNGLNDVISDRALAHAIDNSGMKRLTERRKINGQRVSLVCVRNISPEELLYCYPRDIPSMFGTID